MDEDCSLWTVAEQLYRYSEMDRFLDSVLLFRCIDRECNVFKWKAGQALCDWQSDIDPGTQQRYMTGSTCEGMPLDVCGDIDLMITDHKLPLVVFQSSSEVRQSQSENDILKYIVAEPSVDNPAFTKLKYKSAENTFLYSSEKFVEGMKCLKRVGQDDLETHGPARSGPLNPTIPEYGEVDHVGCLRCLKWPPSAQEFFTRPRTANWPSAGLLQRLREKGCHTVAVGPPSVDRKDIYWRFSFSIAETTLIHEMNISIYACYYFLKVMKKTKIPEEILESGVVCSYFFKSACLWFAETAEASSGISIMSKIRHILDWLIACYQKHHLPHYFLPQQNLIKDIPVEKCKDFADHLSKVKSTIWSCVLSIPQLDEVRHAVCELTERLGVDRDSNPSVLVEALKIHSEAAVVLEKATSMIDRASPNYKERELLSWQSAFVNIQYADKEFFIKQPELVTSRPKELMQYTMEKLPFYFTAGNIDFFKTVLLRCMARVYHELACHFRENQDGTLSKLCNEKVVEYFKQGISLMFPNGQTDKGLSGHVQLAQLHYLNGEWDEVESIMKIVFKIMDDEAVHNAPPASIHHKHEMSLIWKSDTVLFQMLIEKFKSRGSSTSKPIWIQFPTDVLAYYIRCRLSLVLGNSQVAACDIQALLSRITRIKHTEEYEYSHIIVTRLQNLYRELISKMYH